MFHVEGGLLENSHSIDWLLQFQDHKAFGSAVRRFCLSDGKIDSNVLSVEGMRDRLSLIRPKEFLKVLFEVQGIDVTSEECNVEKQRALIVKAENDVIMANKKFHDVVKFRETVDAGEFFAVNGYHVCFDESVDEEEKLATLQVMEEAKAVEVIHEDEVLIEPVSPSFVKALKGSKLEEAILVTEVAKHQEFNYGNFYFDTDYLVLSFESEFEIRRLISKDKNVLFCSDVRYAVLPSVTVYGDVDNYKRLLKCCYQTFTKICFANVSLTDFLGNARTSPTVPPSAYRCRRSRGGYETSLLVDSLSENSISGMVDPDGHLGATSSSIFPRKRKRRKLGSEKMNSTEK